MAHTYIFVKMVKWQEIRKLLKTMKLDGHLLDLVSP